MSDAIAYDVVIVGAGQGGATCATALRQQGFLGSIAIVGDEIDPPYERPALSKEYLAEQKTFEKMLLRPAHVWTDRKIDLRLGHRVMAVDANAHSVRLDDESAIQYGTLVWAAGGTPRELPCGGHHLRGVHTVRSRADVDRMKTELTSANNIVIVGGGYIGLEVAAVLIEQKKRVMILEERDRVLARVAGVALSRFFENEHRSHGVEIRLSTQVDFIEERDGSASGVRLHGGEVLPADMVVVGIGITPSIAPLAAAGANTQDGVVIDSHGKTSLPDVYALGDCAAHANPYAGGAVIRLESIQNANDQALIIAKALTGKLEHYEAIPSFWSDQYDLKLQTMGLSIGHDAIVVRGIPASKKFSLLYLRKSLVIAADCVNTMKDYIQSKALIVSKRAFDPAQLARTDIELKSLL